MTGALRGLAAGLLAGAAVSTMAFGGDLELKLEERISAELQRTTGAQSSELLSIQRFYSERAFAPVWVGGSTGGERAKAAAAVLANAAKDGLDAKDYALPGITARLNSTGPTELADLEFLLSRALVDFAGDVATGRVQPGRVDPELHLAPKRSEPLLLLSNAAAATDLDAYVRSLTPATPEYDRLRSALADYRAVQQRGGWTSVPPGQKLQVGMRDERVRKLRARLAETGELAGPGEDPALYDAAVEQSVKKFQARHGLTEDGITSGTTLTALNVPVERRIEQMLLNLERRRWMPADLGERYIFVNLADFVLKVVDGPRTIYDARVIVGKPYHRTPVFSGMMSYIVLNPYWHVPPSIAVNELLPKAKKNPGYLSSQGIRVFTGWSGDAAEISPHNVDWSSLGPGYFPYKLRQDSGDKNSLGRVKFMFPNQFNVYLHDTPSRELFQRTVRSFSHGCIRVHKPLDLAELLLKDDPAWTRQRIDAVVAQGGQSIVNLKRPIPVHLTYLTAWVNKDGSVHFRDDIYGRDKRLEAALKLDREQALGSRI